MKKHGILFAVMEDVFDNFVIPGWVMALNKVLTVGIPACSCMCAVGTGSPFTDVLGFIC